jgi:hypothetical protein
MILTSEAPRERGSRRPAGQSTRGGSSVGQSSGLIIRRSQVQVLPAPPIYLRFCRGSRADWGESGANGIDRTVGSIRAPSLA